MKNEANGKEPKVNKQDLLVSKEEWMEYLFVQRMGMFNMLDPMARSMTSMDREQWIHIIKNYQYFVDLYGNGE